MSEHIIIFSDIDIIDIKLSDILRISTQAKLVFNKINEIYSDNIFDIYMNIINNNDNINLLKLPIRDNILYNNDYSNKILIPIINDNKYTYGNAIIFNTSNKIIKIDWDIDNDKKIGNYMKLKYDSNADLYTDNNYYFLDWFKILEEDKLFKTQIYYNTSFDTINISNNKVYVIRDCTKNKCIKMVGDTYYKTRNIIDNYTYELIEFEDRIVLKNDTVDIIGYKLNNKYRISNLVYIEKIKEHGFINTINKDSYDVYILNDNKLHNYIKTDVEIILYDKYYYFKDNNEHELLLTKLIPSLENILYSINYRKDIYSLDKIIKILNIYNYKLVDLSICNINLISNIITDKINIYKSSLFNNKYKYKYIYNYNVNIKDITEINELIIFYLNDISILIPDIKEIIDILIIDNTDNILNIFDDILNTNILLCKNYLKEISICLEDLLLANIIQKYKLHKKYYNLNDINKNIFIINFNKIIELILFNNYYKFIKQYYNILNINILNKPLYNLYIWINYNSIDNGFTYYNKLYNNLLIKEKININIIKELQYKIENKIENKIGDKIDKKIVKKYYNINELIEDNNIEYVLCDIEYINKNEILNITLDNLNDILVNGYKDKDKILIHYFKHINKSYIINYILKYNKINNNVFYSIADKNNEIKIPLRFVNDGDLCILHKKYYNRINNTWELYDNYNYSNLYIDKNIINYTDIYKHLNNTTNISSKYYNLLYNNIDNRKNNNINEILYIEDRLKNELNIFTNDVKKNIEFEITEDINLEDYIDKLNYIDNGYRSIKEFYKLKDKKYGDYELLDNSKSIMDKYNRRQQNIITNGFKYFFKYEFVKYIANIGHDVNRAFYKCYDLLLPYKEFINKPVLYGAFIAEAPGSFIHCVRYLRNNNNWNDFKIITLIEDANTIHQNNFYKKFKKQLVYNRNNNGDVTQKNNLLEFKLNIQQLTNNKLADITTADGGFAMNKEWFEYNLQENITTQVIFGEIIASIITQAYDGIFILKVFDLYTDLMVKMIFLLKLVYKKVIINKPINSRIANSEKYICCSGFKYKPDSPIRLELEDILLNIIDKWDNNIGANNTYKISELFTKIKLSDNYINNIQSINNYFSTSSIFIQNKTYEMINNDEFILLIDKYNKFMNIGNIDIIQYFESRINDAKKYCIEYNIPYITKFDNISKCPHNNDIKRALSINNINDIKNIINKYKVDNNDKIILNEIYELIHNTDLSTNLDDLLLLFKNHNNNLNDKIKYYLGNFICKYCYEPIICKHYNLMPNITETINHYGISNDNIDCYLCGEYLAPNDSINAEFSSSGKLIMRISEGDINYLNNGYINNNINNKQFDIEHIYKIYKYKQNIIDDNISLMNLIFEYLNSKYLKIDYRMDDIYIIYHLLYNDYIKDIYSDINNIIQKHIISFDDYKNIFKDLFLISKSDNNTIRNIKNILQDKLQIPSINNKSELINYINKFYNNLYEYYYSNYFSIILFSIYVFKTLIQDKYYIDYITSKFDSDINIINDINYKIFDNNKDFNLFSSNIILFNNLNIIVNNSLNSSQYNKLFNISTYITNKDPINSKTILYNLTTKINEYIEPKLLHYINIERQPTHIIPEIIILYKSITNNKIIYNNSTTINLHNTLESSNFYNNNNINITYIDKIRILLLFNYEESFISKSRIFNQNNIDINTQLSYSQILINISLLTISQIITFYESIVFNKQNFIKIDNYLDTKFNNYYKFIEHNLNLDFNFKINSDLDIINKYKSIIIKQNFIKYNINNLSIIKLKTILYNINKTISFISNFDNNTSFNSYYLKYKSKYTIFYENILQYLLADFYLFNNYNEELDSNNILLKYLCLYIKNNILNKYKLNNGNNYILTYIYPFILHNIISDINNISIDTVTIYLKSLHITNFNKLINNFINYKTKIFSIIQLIIDNTASYSFVNNTNIIHNIIDNNINIDLINDNINPDNIEFINSIITEVSISDDNEYNNEHFDFQYEDNDIDQEYEYD